MFKKGLQFAIISYLIARLEWALEVSKLAIMRLAPKPQIVHVKKNILIDKNEGWVMTDKVDYFMCIDEETGAPNIQALPEKVMN
ncbi:MAG: hypothetical protein ACE5I1_06115 [bacterium]